MDGLSGGDGDSDSSKAYLVLGRDHCDTLSTTTNLAVSLLSQGKHAEAAEIGREVLAQETRLLGAEHEDTLSTAINLALSLSNCGQKTECEQIFRDALAVARRTLGPAHKITQGVLQNFHALGLVAR